MLDSASAPAPAESVGHNGATSPRAPRTMTPIRTITFTTDDGFSGITQDLYSRWKKLYPDIDITDTLADIELAVEEKNYRPRDWQKFIERWLAKEQAQETKKTKKKEPIHD